jgi:hypothetical protein
MHFIKITTIICSPVLQIKPTKKKSVGEPSSPAANLCMSMLKSAAEKKLSQSASGFLQLEPQENHTSVSVVEISTKKDDGKISSQSESSASQEKQTSLSVVEIISKKEKSPSQEARKKKQEKTVEISLTLDQIMQKKLDRYFGISS